MEGLDERLAAVGLTRSKLADRLGISKAAVSQWKAVPEKAEELLREVERASVGVIPLGAMVRCDNGEVGRVVVVERNECLFGSKRMRWVYLVCAARQDKEGAWELVGSARRWPEQSLTEVHEEHVWAEKRIETKDER